MTAQSCLWRPAPQNSPVALALADRHYSRVTPGSKGFMPPGRMCILLSPAGDALWGASWPYAHLATHKRGDAWLCTIFRNEGPVLSSTLIQAAVAATRDTWGAPPQQGYLTWVDPAKTRHKRDPGRCFRKAGWSCIDTTPGGLLVFQCMVNDPAQCVVDEGGSGP
jgi:hypothetical protein